jgi:hypothetical protein
VLAVSSGFCKRKGKLKPEVFFEMLFKTVSHTEQGSLSYMVSMLKSDFGVTMEKQSLDERFNKSCVEFVKAVLSEVISEEFAKLYSGALLPDFSRIRIKDSTKFIVPSNLEGSYRSCGGDLNGSSKASISIQYEYDLKSGEIICLDITSGDRNDRKDAGETAHQIEKDDLVIRDLGYYSTPVLKGFSEKGAFFLSRLNCSTSVYDESGLLISFGDIYKSMKKAGIVQKEMVVFAGKEAKLPVRLILQLVPDEAYEQRIREKTKKSKKQRRGQLTQETIIRCRFSLFITNAQESSLSMEQVYPLYRLRWQVELQFKLWKSVFNIDTLQKMKEHRYITSLYVKLILIIINMQIYCSVQQAFAQPVKGKIKAISPQKAMKTLKTLFNKIFSMFRGTLRKAVKTAQYIQCILLENHWLESKKKKLCLPEILTLFICKSE